MSPALKGTMVSAPRGAACSSASCGSVLLCRSPHRSLGGQPGSPAFLLRSVPLKAGSVLSGSASAWPTIA
eukprot:6735619-Heterocapsa_arctica.AAC.1